MSATLRARSFALLPVFLVAILVASLFSLAPSADAAARGKRISKGVEIAANQVGDPYKYGAKGPNRFDCSGLVYYSYRKAGISVPRTSDAQARKAHRIKRKNMKRGDLMFFHNGGNVYHVAVFAGWHKGKRRMIHAPSSGKRVHRANPWTNSWFPGTLR